MKNQIRSLLSTFRVDPYTKPKATAHRERAYDRVINQLGSSSAYRVLGGPYRGMKYFGEDEIPEVDRIPAPKMVGSFELEIHPWIEELVSRDFKMVVHIGLGEGYHAVGMARRMTRARFVAFDTLIAARHACTALAEQNDVRARIQLWGFCGPNSLKEIELDGSLVFSDCGGAELTLLDPVVYPGLQRATILAETHDAFDERITSRLTTRFLDTHRVEPVTTTPRNPSNHSLPVPMDPESARMALDERRKLSKSGKPKAWLMLTPR